MKKIKSKFSATLVFALVVAAASFGVNAANAAPIDVSYLQTCLKVEGSSLDVLVLMDSSASLRDARADDGYVRDNKDGSDPEQMRGKILKSSLKILRSLAQESDRAFNISLRNFGNNSNPKELKNLQSHWQDWSAKTSDADLNKFVDNALYDDSTMTEWTSGLATAKNQFKQRIGQAELAGTKSCSIMFWITDGAPTDSTAPICAENSSASINWFRANNILVLGGLLQPKEGTARDGAGQFRPIVTGENEKCGRNEQGWTRGEVIEANDVSDLAWGFIGLIASIKNLVDLNSEDSTFYVDPSTSHIEISIRGDQKIWEVKQPDGKVVCSSSSLGERCQVLADSEIGITTIVIYPERPTSADGSWEVSPKFSDESMQVYGGLDSSGPIPRAKQAKLLINPKSAEVDEGKDVSFEAKLVNADGSPFSLDGFKTISICAKVDSAKNSKCNSGSTSTSLSVSPTTSDKSVAFEAILVSARGESSREYRIVANARLNVIQSGAFPSLICEEDPCKLTSLANKNDKAESNLRVVAAKDGSSDGRVSIVGFTVLSDSIENRGDGNFEFKLQTSNGSDVELNSQGEYFSPGDELKLTVSTDIAGDSEIQGIVKYKVFSDGKEIVRQLPYKFEVGSKKNLPLQLALLLLAYLLTVGLPYLYLLWSARRAAVLSVSDGEFAYLEEPVTIAESGKVVSRASTVENAIASTLDPSHEGLKFEVVEDGARSISIGNVQIEVIPPKWNPFVEPETHVCIKENHILSTFGGAEFLEDRAFFSRSLTGEALIYFPTEPNLAPLAAEDVDSLEPDSKSELFSSSSTKPQSEEILIKSGVIHATALYLVPRYDNRRKSLSDVNSRLKSTIESANLGVHITELRQSALDAELLRIVEMKKAEQSQSAKKRDKKATDEDKTLNQGSVVTGEVSNRDSFFEEEIKSDSNNLFSNDNETPDSDSGKKLW
jgi:hypothetical protein